LPTVEGIVVFDSLLWLKMILYAAVRAVEKIVYTDVICGIFCIYNYSRQVKLNGDGVMQKEVIHTGDNLEELMIGLTDFRARMVARKLRNIPISDDMVDSLLKQLVYLKAE
jgi:uncharacterized protein YabE (DUF348 family)